MSNSNKQHITKLALGTVQFGLTYGIANKTGKVSKAEASKILALAVRSGIDTIDTAIGYGDSEQCLGTLGVQDLKIITKLPPLPDKTGEVKAWVKTQVHESLKRLNTSKLYALLLHKPLDLVDIHGRALYEALQDIKEKELVGKIGISVYSPDELELLIPKFSLDIVQGPLNIIDRRLKISGWLNKLKNRDIEVHTRSTFLQGLLLMDAESRPGKFSTWTTLWNNWQNYINISDEVFEVAALSASLSYPMSLPEVDRVLVGTDSCSQLDDIISASKQLRTDFPDTFCSDENLVNPANWDNL